MNRARLPLVVVLMMLTAAALPMSGIGQGSAAPAAMPAAIPADAGPYAGQPPSTQTALAESIGLPQADVTLSQSTSSLINVTVENETLENVVAMFTRISGANIVATSANLEGLVTVNLKDVEWKPALNAILEVHSLGLVEKMPGSGVYSIVPKPPEKSEPLVLDTLFLSYTTVAEVKPVIATMLTAVTNAMITEFPSRNAMVVKTTEANLSEIKTLIAAMDQPGKQVCVEAKFVELTDEASKVLGIDWSILGQGDSSPGIVIGGSGLKATFDKTQERNKYNGSAQYETQEREWSRTRDLEENEVVDGTDLGSETLGQKSFQGRAAGENLSSLDPGAGTWTPLKTDNSKFSVQGAILSVSDLNIVLNALKTTSGISIISNPKIIVASGSTNAFFKVGEREPIVRTEIVRGNAAAGQSDQIVAQLDTALSTDFIKGGYLETGISLVVVPVVKTDSMIEAIIQPKLTRNLLRDKTVALEGGFENSWPRISMKEITTKFTLRSGQTVAIGGLTDTTDSKKVTKIPLLGDIPLIGKYLFSHTNDSKRQTETVILVTLALAEPENLREETGIPDDAKLIHKQLLRAQTEKREFQQDLQKMKAAADAQGATMPETPKPGSPE